MQYERAAALRDKVRAIERTMEAQKMAGFARRELDVLGFARSGNEAAVQLFAIRDGKTVSRDVFQLENLGDGPDEEALSARSCASTTRRPARCRRGCCCRRACPDADELRRCCAARRGSNVALTVPQRGEGRGAHGRSPARNAAETLAREQARWLADQGRTLGALEELATALGLPAPPMRIECYDISTIQGTNTVGSMVVFEEGRPRSGDYRRFRIKTVEGTDDFASHREVFRRRFRRALDERGGERRGAALADARPGHHRRRQGSGQRRPRRARRAGAARPAAGRAGQGARGAVPARPQRRVQEAEQGSARVQDRVQGAESRAGCRGCKTGFKEQTKNKEQGPSHSPPLRFEMSPISQEGEAANKNLFQINSLRAQYGGKS